MPRYIDAFIDIQRIAKSALHHEPINLDVVAGLQQRITLLLEDQEIVGLDRSSLVNGSNLCLAILNPVTEEVSAPKQPGIIRVGDFAEIRQRPFNAGKVSRKRSSGGFDPGF